MRFIEYRNDRKIYVLVDSNGIAVMRPGGKDSYKTEAISQAKAKAQIMHQIRSAVRGPVEWEVIRNPDDYDAMLFDDWYKKQRAKEDVRFAKQPPPSLPERKKEHTQGEFFNKQRWVVQSNRFVHSLSIVPLIVNSMKTANNIIEMMMVII